MKSLCEKHGFFDQNECPCCNKPGSYEAIAQRPLTLSSVASEIRAMADGFGEIAAAAQRVIGLKGEARKTAMAAFRATARRVLGD